MAKKAVKKSKKASQAANTHPSDGSIVSSKDYNAVVKCAQLERIDLNEAHFKVLPEYLIDNDSRRSFRYDHDLKHISHKVDGVSTKLMSEESGLVAADILWNIRVRVGRRIALRIDTNYTVIYSGMNEVSTDAALLFMEKVAPVATYAYFRAHVSQLNWAADIDLPMLPVYSSHH